MEQSAALEIGMSEFTTQPWTFEQDVDHFAQHRIQAIEVCEVKLARDRMHDQLRLPGEHGLRISSAQPAIRTLFPSKSQPEPVPVQQRMDLFRRTIESFGIYAQGLPFVTNTGIPPGGNIQEEIGR